MLDFPLAYKGWDKIVRVDRKQNLKMGIDFVLKWGINYALCLPTV